MFEKEVGMRRGGTGRETYPVRMLGKDFSGDMNLT